MTVGRLLDRRQSAVVTCHADMSVADATALLATRKIGALPVLDGETLVGIFSERDLLYRIAEEGADALSRSVRDVMTAEPVTVDRSTSVLAALSLITRRRIRHLPVVEDGRMVGLVSIGDLVKYRIDQIEAEAEAMRSYIQTA
jgi:CBS domain-containing protein